MKFFDLFFPSKCLNCNSVLKSEQYLCKTCFYKITFIKKSCRVCGKPIAPEEVSCQNCRNLPPVLDFFHSITVFDNVMKNLIHKLKFGYNKKTAVFLGDLLSDYLAGNSAPENIDLILPAPISEERRKLRGYNQTELIADEVNKKTGLKILKNAVHKKDIPPQTGLGSRERKNNIRDSFIITDKKDIVNKNILVIDDVITTGSTLTELAKTLKISGCKKVSGLGLCHGI